MGTMKNGELVIDADGHILEPPDLWERYLELKYRDRAMRIKRDSEGWEYLEIAGKPSKFCVRGSLTRLGSMGREIDHMKERRELWKAGKIDKPFIGLSPDEGYTKDLAFGAMDPKERVQRLDQEGISKAVIYPTIGIMWEPECPDLDLAYAYCRAYNRWIADFCRDSGGRLVPIAHISLADPARAVEELQRAVKDGCKGAFCIPFTLTRKPHGHPFHDPIFAALQDLDIPLGFHPNGTEPDDLTLHQRFDNMKGPARIWYSDMFVGAGTQMPFDTLFMYGVFDKFPKLRVVVLESGAGWIGWWLDRADNLYKGTILGGALPLREPPSYYFSRQCFISADPDEQRLALITDSVGPDKFFWASDFPHSDHRGDYMEEPEELVQKMSPQSARGILGENVARAYNLT
jgi:predicted TIM-barrel fold metal-dependent hydrolase